MATRRDVLNGLVATAAVGLVPHAIAQPGIRWVIRADPGLAGMVVILRIREKFAEVMRIPADAIEIVRPSGPNWMEQLRDRSPDQTVVEL